MVQFDASYQPGSQGRILAQFLKDACVALREEISTAFPSTAAILPLTGKSRASSASSHGSGGSSAPASSEALILIQIAPPRTSES